MVLQIMLIFGAFSIGLIAGGALGQTVVNDLRDLLAHLLENPNDESTRAIVRATLYQKQ